MDNLVAKKADARAKRSRAYVKPDLRKGPRLDAITAAPPGSVLI